MAVIKGTKPYTKVARSSKEYANLAYGDTIYLMPAPAPTSGDIGVLMIAQWRIGGTTMADRLMFTADPTASPVEWTQIADLGDAAHLNADRTVGSGNSRRVIRTNIDIQAMEYIGERVYIIVKDDQQTDAGTIEDGAVYSFIPTIEGGKVTGITGWTKNGVIAGEPAIQGLAYNGTDAYAVVSGRTDVVRKFTPPNTLDATSVAITGSRNFETVGFGYHEDAFYSAGWSRYELGKLSGNPLTYAAEFQGNGANLADPKVMLSWDGSLIVINDNAGSYKYNPNPKGFTAISASNPLPNGAQASAGCVISMPIVTFTLNAAVINAAANGVFSGLGWSFSHNGQQYDIDGCFTHNNGWQLRFADDAHAAAFVASGLKVNTGISGQFPFRTSVMEHISIIKAGQYRAFPGRYTPNTAFTITISA